MAQGGLTANSHAGRLRLRASLVMRRERRDGGWQGLGPTVNRYWFFLKDVWISQPILF